VSVAPGVQRRVEKEYTLKSCRVSVRPGCFWLLCPGEYTIAVPLERPTENERAIALSSEVLRLEELPAGWVTARLAEVIQPSNETVEPPALIREVRQ